MALGFLFWTHRPLALTHWEEVVPSPPRKPHSQQPLFSESALRGTAAVVGPRLDESTGYGSLSRALEGCSRLSQVGGSPKAKAPERTMTDEMRGDRLRGQAGGSGGCRWLARGPGSPGAGDWHLGAAGADGRPQLRASSPAWNWCARHQPGLERGSALLDSWRFLKYHILSSLAASFPACQAHHPADSYSFLGIQPPCHLHQAGFSAPPSCGQPLLCAQHPLLSGTQRAL